MGLSSTFNQGLNQLAACLKVFSMLYCRRLGKRLKELNLLLAKFVCLSTCCSLSVGALLSQA
jgi:hypothetical protein